MKRIVAYATLALGLALPFVPVLAGNCAIPVQQDSTCSTAISSAAIPPPSCGANQTQTSAPTWNGSSWVGLACQSAPPPSMASLWPPAGSVIWFWQGSIYERMSIQSNGQILMMKKPPFAPSWQLMYVVGSTGGGTSFDLTGAFNQGWGNPYWSYASISNNSLVIIPNAGYGTTWPNENYSWASHGDTVLCNPGISWCMAGIN